MFLIPKFIILKTIFPFLAFLVAWELVRKWIALYKAGQQKELWRFICIFIFNTFGLLPIIYLLVDCIRTDNNNLPEKNDKKETEIKQSKKALKGGVKKWENATPVKKPKGTPKDSWKKRTVNATKK